MSSGSRASAQSVTSSELGSRGEFWDSERNLKIGSGFYVWEDRLGRGFKGLGFGV